MKIGRLTVVYATAVILAVLVARRYATLGGPYLILPETVADHVWIGPNSTRDAILACRRAAPHIPRGAEVTVLERRAVSH